MKLNKSLISFFKYSFYFIVIIYFNFAIAQVDTSNKKEAYSNVKKLNIEVSNLEKPSLGSIGVKTKLNNIMGLDIWKGMNATDIVEHFSYIPDVVTSKSLQALLIQLYLSSSNPPSGTSEDIIKFSLLEFIIAASSPIPTIDELRVFLNFEFIKSTIPNSPILFKSVVFILIYFNKYNLIFSFVNN